VSNCAIGYYYALDGAVAAKACAQAAADLGGIFRYDAILEFDVCGRASAKSSSAINIALRGIT
jgi:hypothetical protein